MKKSIYIQRLDRIQSEIWAKLLKPIGFKKRGRSFNRKTADDLIQVIEFQLGQAYLNDNDKFSVYIGIRVPESFEKTFVETEQIKSFYQYQYCNIVTCLNDRTLGHSAYKASNGTSYNAKMFMLDMEDLRPTIEEIEEMFETHVFPFLDDMNTREKVLANRLKYHVKYKMFELSNTIDLDEAMIYGRAGNLEKAKQIIQQRYDNSVTHKPHQEYLISLSKELGIMLET